MWLAPAQSHTTHGVHTNHNKSHPAVPQPIAGVGKTELAKALAAFMFNAEDALVRPICGR